MPKENYDRIMQQEIAVLCRDRVPRLLLHSCCGPCSSAVLEKLCPFFDVTVYYYDPNIHPREEYDRRAREQARLLEEMRPAGKQVGLIAAEWDAENWFSLTRGLEDEKEGGRRCEVCFEMRLMKTAEAALRGGFDLFTTTLTVSPHKDPDKVNAAGFRAEKATGARYLPSDFKKRDGYLRSLRLSAEYSLYRQNYCGCVYSMRKDSGFPESDK